MFPFNGSPGSGSSGGGGITPPAVQPITWTEVDSAADLIAALATGGANILLTGDFSVSSAIAAIAGRYVIAKNDGVQVTFTSSGQITAASANTVFNWHYSCWDRVSPTLVINNTGVFGQPFQNTTNIQHEGFLSVDCIISSAYTSSFGNNRHNMQALSIRTNGSKCSLGIGSIELIDAQATAGASYLEIKNSVRRILMRGDWLQDDGSSAAISTAGLRIAQGGFQSAVEVGSVEFLDPTTTPCVAIVGTSGPARVGSISCYASGVTPKVGLTGQASLGASYVSPIFGANGTSNFKPVFQDCYLVSPRWVSANGVILRNCKVSFNATFPSGSLPELESCRFLGSTSTFASGSMPLINNCTIDTAVVLSSGAIARCTNFSGSGTLTNSDPLSIVTGSQNPSWDTTPHTARYESTVLDPLLGRLVFSYPGNTEGEANRAPHQRASGVIGIESSSGASMDSGYYVSSTTGRFRGRVNWGAPSRLGWSLSFFWRPTSISFGGAEQNVMTLSDVLGNFIALNQIDNNLRVYVGGVGFYSTSTAGNLFSTSTARLVVVSVRVNAGSLTLYVRVNGTQVIAASGAPTLSHNFVDLILGANGTDARAGRFTKIEAFDLGLSNTQMDELLTKSLLSGMAV